MSTRFFSSYEAWVTSLEPLTEKQLAEKLEERARLEAQVVAATARIAEHGSTPQRESVLQAKAHRLHEIELHLKHRSPEVAA